MADVKKYILGSINTVVYNAPNTTSDPREYGYSSWREYWEDHGHDRNDRSLHPIDTEIVDNETNEIIKKYRCPKCGEYFHWDKDDSDCFDGCHVRIKGDDSGKLYLTPLCHGCNHEKGLIVIPRRMLEEAPPVKTQAN